MKVSCTILSEREVSNPIYMRGHDALLKYNDCYAHATPLHYV